MEVVDFVIVGILLLACIETGEIMVCDAAAAEAADMMENDVSRPMTSIIILHNIEDMVIEERCRSGYYGDWKRVRGGEAQTNIIDSSRGTVMVTKSQDLCMLHSGPAHIFRYRQRSAKIPKKVFPPYLKIDF